MSDMIKKLEAIGFKRHNTGGGCMAMRYAPADSSWEILIDDENDLPSDSAWRCCGYGPDLCETVYAIDQDGAEDVFAALRDCMTAIYQDWIDQSGYEQLSIDEQIAELWAKLPQIKDPRGEEAGRISADLDWLKAFEKDWERICFA